MDARATTRRVCFVGHRRLALIVLLSSLALPCHACEPVIPFMSVVGGPGYLTKSWFILLGAIGMKAGVFAFTQKRLSFVRALLLMVAGNVLTTFIGFLAAAMIGSGGIMLVGILIVWAVCIVPAKRLLATVKRPWLDRFSAGGLAAMMSFALALSCILFAISASFADSNQMIVYWIWKLAAVYIALIVSIVLTAFWEEWVIWKFSSCPIEYSGYVKPVIRANLVVLLCVMLFGAAVTLPKRFKSHDFLVSLGLIHETSLSQNRER